MISLFVQRPDEIKVAYQHFFEILDKADQKFEYQFRIGKSASGDGLDDDNRLREWEKRKGVLLSAQFLSHCRENEAKWLIATIHFSAAKA